MPLLTSLLGNYLLPFTAPILMRIDLRPRILGARPNRSKPPAGRLCLVWQVNLHRKPPAGNANLFHISFLQVKTSKPPAWKSGEKLRQTPAPLRCGGGGKGCLFDNQCCQPDNAIDCRGLRPGPRSKADTSRHPLVAGHVQHADERLDFVQTA